MIVSNTLRLALTTQIPNTDFTTYFNFIESLPEMSKGRGFHKHHILPKKEFPEFKQNVSNLIYLSAENHFKAHYYLAVCAQQYAPFQLMFFMMANLHRQIQRDELTLFANIYALGAKAVYDNATKGHLIGVRTLEHQTRAGQAAGRKNVNSGWAYKLGHIYGRKAVDTGLLASFRTPEHQQNAAQKAGKIAVQKGQIQTLATFEDRSKGGKRRIQLHGNPATPDGIKKGAKKGGHIRWHVNTNKSNPNCYLCKAPRGLPQTRPR